VKKLALATLLFAATILLMSVGTGVAQDATATETPVATSTGPFNTTEGTLIVCADSAVLNFSGISLIGWDVYYQIFSGSAGSGTALTNLRQVPVAGEYSVSDRVSYNTGLSVAAGGQASAKVDVARENDPTNIDYSFVLTDAQDGCAEPTNTVAEGIDTTSVTGGTGTSGTPGVTTSILAPNGGVLNSTLVAEPSVVIGARLSDRYRSDTPGLIFAECDAYPLAEPGLIYDTDRVTIFWSWFTKTRELMDDHLANAIYTVNLNTADLPMTTRSEPVLRNGDYWVFYTATVGNLRPGHYEVGYLLTWANPVNDGYDDYGPGTANPRQSGICNFDVLLNGDGVSVVHTGMYFPTNFAVHDIVPTDQP
jgi:hypothetical protein